MFDTQPLGNLIDFFNGKAIKPGGSGQYPAYGSNGLIGGSDESKYENAIIIGRVGAYCGSIAYCPTRFWASDNTIVARPKSPSGDVRYFAYLLQFLELNRHAGGAAQPLVTQTTLRQVMAPAAPEPTQRRIAFILSAYDDLIENNSRRIAILEEMARRLYEEWFVHFRFPGHEQARMVESELGLIPEGWSVERVGDVLQRLPAGTTYKKEQVHETGNVIVVDQSTADYLGFHDAAPDHLASVDTPIAIFGDHTCKLTLMVRPFSIGPNTVPFIGAKSLDTAYTFQLVQGLVSTHEYKRHWTSLSDKQVVLCPMALAATYGKRVRGMVHLMLLLNEKNANLRAQRDLLLPKLISGEIDVSAFPEPEAVAA